MLPSNTICVSQEGPANALALNKDCTQVVIAGRNVFKVFSIGENEFAEVHNLRVGKNLNLNFSSIDVAWSAIDENTLATAATNGAVVVWNLSRSGRSKQEHVFSDHKRTVNKVSFHLTEPAMLISGSQDGMMKYFDLRMKEVARTFISNTESIRDVQFSPHQAHTFAAVSENGSVQVWDVRRHERCLQQFTAHSGPVFACDWHPAAPWLATASRDKTIKVWDMHTKPNLEHTIYTIASVGHVKWRPHKMYQVCSCALVLDCAVHVWDVRRPHVPLATFAEHRDVTTAIAWLRHKDEFLSTSRDCSLYRHRFSEAAHPVLWANPHAVCLSARGEVARALPERPLPALAATRHAPDRHVPALGRKQPTAGSLSAESQAILERTFARGAASTLRRYTVPAGDGGAHAALVACAVEYRMRGAPTHELAIHNAAVAAKYDRHNVSHVWSVMHVVYSARARAGGGCAGAAGAGPQPQPPAEPPPRPPPPPRQQPYSGGSVVEEEEDIAEIEEWAENQFHMNGVLGMPTHSIYIPPAKFAKLTVDDDAVWVPASTAHYVDEDAMDWTLPEEAFPLRAAPPAAAGASAGPAPAPAATGAQYAPDELAHTLSAVSLTGVAGAGCPARARDADSGSDTSSSGSSASSAPAHAAHSPSHSRHEFARQTSTATLDEGECVPLSVRCGGPARAAPFDAAPHLAAALRLHADLGDVQTACVAMLVLQEHRSDLFPYIEESLQEQWLLGYIELMHRHKLWNVATVVIRHSWLTSVWSLSQQSTCVAVCCARCGRRTRPHQPCERCQPRAKHDLCAVCHTVVRGLYAWCQGCSHGGHLPHMRQWFARHKPCPAGCGHHCEMGL